MDKEKPSSEFHSEKIADVVTIYNRGRVWQATYQIHGRQRRKSLKTSSKKEAVRKATKLAAQLLDGSYLESAKTPSIKAVTDAYVAHLRTERKAKRTVQKVELVIKRLLDLAERRKAKSIADINLRFIDAYRAERVAKDAHPKTVLNETVILRQIVNFALSREMLAQDPLRRLKLKKVKPSPQPCWSRGEVDAILAAADERYCSALTMLAETGMRVGELKHLTWDDVDSSVIRIRAKEDWKPKTGDERAIPITSGTKKILEELPRKGPWVFTAQKTSRFPNDGRQISERRLLQYLKRLLKKLGLRGHLHTFRHAFISNALINRIPEAVVRQWVGHVDADIMKLYTHIADEASKEAMQRLEDANQTNRKTQGSGGA